jgi:hypothetical protein
MRDTGGSCEPSNQPELNFMNTSNETLNNPFIIRKENGKFHYNLKATGEYVGWIHRDNKEDDRWSFYSYLKNGTTEYAKGFEGRENAEIFLGLSIGRSYK